MSDAYQVFLPGETLSASALQDLGEQRTYTPALQGTTTNPTLGAGSSAAGDYLLHAGFVTVGFSIQFGTSGAVAGAGTYRLTLPTGLGLDADWQDNRAVGCCWVNDASASGFYYYFIRTSSSNPDTVLFGTSASPTTSVTATSPFVPAANDYLRGSFTYKTDFT